MQPPAASAAALTPDPVAVCEYIIKLKQELRFARRLLRLTQDARGSIPVGAAALNRSPSIPSATSARCANQTTPTPTVETTLTGAVNG